MACNLIPKFWQEGNVLLWTEEVDLCPFLFEKGKEVRYFISNSSFPSKIECLHSFETFCISTMIRRKEEGDPYIRHDGDI